MTDVLNQIGLFVGTENEIQILDPTVKNKSAKLREHSELFMSKNNDFKESVSAFIDGLALIVDKVEREKFKAIGTRTLIKMLEMDRERSKDKYRNMIREKQLELERMRLEYESLKREDLEQQNLQHILRQLKG